MKKMNFKFHYRDIAAEHFWETQTHRGNVNLSLSSHNLVINCISLLSTAQASVTV